jgi:D-alanyl-D-alanine carboxypeptidase/D-alanyl-D-alanine-endopeptidase (penicillin-binding protein 4)
MVERGVAATYGATDQRDGVLLRGRFPRGASAVTIRTAVADPAAWYEAALRRALREAGIAVGGEAPALPDQVVHRQRSGLRAAVLRMLEDSSNFDAEQCLRVLGERTRGDGSLAGGRAAMQAELERLVGRLPNGIVLADGSGLSRQNQITPGLLLAALLRARGTPVGEALQACLPVSGRSGTLTGRFSGTDLVGRVRAKTGWIRGASALSGVLERRDGTVRCFAILMNYDPKQDGLNKDLKRLQEEIVRALDRTEG